MRGFFAVSLVLVGLDVMLRAPSSRVAALFVVPTRWLAEWMDPNTPLISKPLPGGGLDAGNPAGKQTNQLGESTTGACPPGFPAGTICAGM